MFSDLISSYSGQSFILPVPAFAFCDLGSKAGTLLVKTEAKKSLSTSTSSTSQVTRSPVPFQRRAAFSPFFLLSPTYLSKLFLLPLTSVARFNSIRALTFLTWSLAAWTIFLYYAQATRPCVNPLEGFFLCLSLSRSSLFIHAGYKHVRLRERPSATWKITHTFAHVLRCFKTESCSLK